jgi:hypothetical protein
MPQQEPARGGRPLGDGVAGGVVEVGQLPAAVLEPPLGSSSGLPGDCMTPSSDRNSETIRLLMGPPSLG